MLWVTWTLSIASVGLLCGCAWLIYARRSLRVERDNLARELGESDAQNQSLKSENHNLSTEIAVVRETHRNLEKRTEESQQQLRDVFKSLATDALKQATDQFLHLANKTLEGERQQATHQLEQRRQAIQSMVQPLQQALDKYNSSLGQVESARKEAYGSLKTQVTTLIEDQKLLRGETANLVRALRRPEVRGRWGEVQLRRVAEMAGMIERCDFYPQESTTDQDKNTHRPDMVVRLPTNRQIVIDAKTPLDAFLSAMESTEDGERAAHLDRHVGQIEKQIKSLSEKPYSEQFDRDPGFVVMFIPGESFLQAATDRQPGLIESAMARGVVIATPTTLISLLKVVALGWREEQLAENARRISELGKQLHERIGVVMSHVQQMGGNLERATDAYNKMVGSLESRVLVSARKLEKLGASSSKSLPGQIRTLDVSPRLPNSLAASSEDGS